MRIFSLSEVRGQMSDVRSQMSEVRCQMSGIRKTSFHAKARNSFPFKA
ncbi:MAG: hypothetical protein FWC38_10275 [Proteobacteria bacterium]|nr:hypothetical protein [Pseudomonadota bacterium]